MDVISNLEVAAPRLRVEYILNLMNLQIAMISSWSMNMVRYLRICKIMHNLRTLHAQDAGMQDGLEYEGGSEHDLHGYSSKITEGENIGKIQCNLCGKISSDGAHSFRHVESLHFPGSFEYECDQCDEKFNTKSKWATHRSKVHSSKKAKWMLIFLLHWTPSPNVPKCVHQEWFLCAYCSRMFQVWVWPLANVVRSLMLTWTTPVCTLAKGKSETISQNILVKSKFSSF